MTKVNFNSTNWWRLTARRLGYQLATAAQDVRPSLCRMWLTWFSTARSDRMSGCPIAALPSPSVTRGGDLELAQGETGLGLADAVRLVQKLGGEWVHSQPSGEHAAVSACSLPT